LFISNISEKKHKEHFGDRGCQLVFKHVDIGGLVDQWQMGTQLGFELLEFLWLGVLWLVHELGIRLGSELVKKLLGMVLDFELLVPWLMLVFQWLVP